MVAEMTRVRYGNDTEIIRTLKLNKLKNKLNRNGPTTMRQVIFVPGKTAKSLEMPRIELKVTHLCVYHRV